jgi:hypothetical protein
VSGHDQVSAVPNRPQTSCLFNQLLLWTASHQLASVQVSAVPNRATISPFGIASASRKTAPEAASLVKQLR